MIRQKLQEYKRAAQLVLRDTFLPHKTARRDFLRKLDTVIKNDSIDDLNEITRVYGRKYGIKWLFEIYNYDVKRMLDAEAHDKLLDIMQRANKRHEVEMVEAVMEELEDILQAALTERRKQAEAQKQQEGASAPIPSPFPPINLN